jgi:hypothetical protein
MLSLKIINPKNQNPQKLNNIVLYLLSVMSKNPNTILNPKNPKPAKKNPNTILNPKNPKAKENPNTNLNPKNPKVKKNPNTNLNKHPKNCNNKKKDSRKNYTDVEWSGVGWRWWLCWSSRMPTERGGGGRQRERRRCRRRQECAWESCARGELRNFGMKRINTVTVSTYTTQILSSCYR